MIAVRPAMSAALGVVLLASLLALAAPPAAAQTTYVVDASHITGTAATDDPDPGACDPGDCSLREAVIAANANAGADIIEFETAGTVALGRSGAEASDATFNDLDLADAVTITGHAGGTTVDAAGLAPGADARAFDTFGDGGVPIAVELRDLTVTGGAATGNGGAVRASTVDLTLTRTTMTANASDIGGAVYAGDVSLVVTDATFTGNDASGDGGAIYSVQHRAIAITGSTFDGNAAGSPEGTGPLGGGTGGAVTLFYDPGTEGPRGIITDSTFTGNDVGNDDGSDGAGGAIFAFATPLSITGTTVTGNGSENTATGGGIHLESTNASPPPGDDGITRITNSDISGNRANGAGGGLYVGPGGIDVEVRSSTVSGNVVSGDMDATGGGIFVDATTSRLRLVNSTVSGNTATIGGGVHLFIQIINLTFNQVPVSAEILHTTMVGNSGRAGLVIDEPDFHEVRIRSTLIADNTEVNCSGSAAIVSLGHNLEDADTCNLGEATDLVDTEPVIGPLADNGGAPQGADGSGVGFTHALLEGSPAIDTASPDSCPDPVADDQRGVTRPQLEGCDIGAYEYVQDIDVAVDKSVDPSVIQVDDTAFFDIMVTNVGDSTASTATLTDVVPDTLAIVSVQPIGICDPPAGQSLTCALGPLAPGESTTITVAVTGTEAGTFTNTAAVSTEGDIDTTNDTDDARLTVGQVCTGADGGEGDGIDPGLVRIEGLNRIQTAIAASQAACGDGEAPAIVLTRSDLFPDAQAGTPLAIDLGAPLLLSDPLTLSPDTETEIERVLAPGGTVYLLGGEVALSAAVDQRLRDIGYSTVRYGGLNRFGTAAIIADDGLDDPTAVLFADGGDFADSIVAGAAAASIGGGAIEAAVLLTSGADIPPETQAYLDARTTPPDDRWAIGGRAGQAFPDLEEISGPSRFETAVAVAERFFAEPTIVGIARADDFADGLTGGALVGRPELGPGPILLVATDSLPSAVEAYLSANAASIETAAIFGGTSAINSSVADDVATALGF